jgi:hypothetical protein
MILRPLPSKHFSIPITIVNEFSSPWALLIAYPIGKGRANESESGAALDGTRLHRFNLSLREIVTRPGDEDTPTRLYWRRILGVSSRDFLSKHSVFQATARVIRDVAELALSGTRRTTS